jgi:transaldolase
MASLIRLYEEHGQSPWLDNLTRPSLRDGTMTGLIARGVRGVTANPTIVARAIESSDAYDRQLHDLLVSGHTLEDAYWELAITDVVAALELLRPTFDASDGADGFVSIEVAPDLANDTDATIKAARYLHERIGEPNLLVKIPATSAGVPAIEAMVAEGRSINVTLVFSLSRYRQVLAAYLSGLEALADRGGDLSTVRGVASFFVSRVDTEVDNRLARIDRPEARELAGTIGIANARLAYAEFERITATERWRRLAAKGAKVQRPLWASTGTKNPAYSDVLYLDQLIGRDTINTVPPETLRKFEEHGTVAPTLAGHQDAARTSMERLARVGVDFDDVTRVLEEEGIEKFAKSYAALVATIGKKREALRKGSAAGR